jgi:hypothetical protein
MLTVLVALVLGIPKPASFPPHVRAVSPVVQLLLDKAAALPTTAALLQRLNESDQVVYVEFTNSPMIPTARTKLVTATSTVRFLRVAINAHVLPGDRLPLLAHELQHAVELANAPDVRDDDGVRQLYRRIGRASGLDEFETAAAMNTERRVRREMAARNGQNHRS